MRDYGKVYGTFWTSETTGAMSDTAKLLALYLMTTTHATIAGVFRMPDGYVAEDLHWDCARVQQGFDELSAKGFATRCSDTKWVWVTKHLDWNPPENPNQIKGARKIAQAVPDNCAWKAEFHRASAAVLGFEVPKAPDPLPTLPKPFPNQKAEDRKQKQGNTLSADADDVGFDAFWKAWPSNPRKVAKRQCQAKWRQRKCAAIADQIVAHVEALKRSDKWREADGQFIPAPLVYLNQDRWEAPTEAEAVGESWADSRSGIEAKGVELGLGKWDELAASLGRGEQFSAYSSRVMRAAGVTA